MRSHKGFTVLETVMFISIMMIFVAIVVPTMNGLIESARETQVEQIVDAGNAALRLDFSSQIMEGAYKSLFPEEDETGDKLDKDNVEVLEALLEPGFSYPPGFQWLLVEQATSTQPPVVGYRII